MPRDPQQFAASTCALVDGLTGHLALVLDNARLSQRLHEMSTLDGLTRQLNHRAIYDRLTEELERARRYRYPLSVILCDLDHFKEVNDTHGHLAGDAVLREGAAVLRRCLRGRPTCWAATAARSSWPCCPRWTSTPARAAAERLRRGLEEAAGAGSPRQPRGADHRLVRGGLDRDELDRPRPRDLLVSLADRRLYEAKAAGRNRVRPDAG